VQHGRLASIFEPNIRFILHCVIAVRVYRLKQNVALKSRAAYDWDLALGVSLLFCAENPHLGTNVHQDVASRFTARQKCCFIIFLEVQCTETQLLGTRYNKRNKTVHKRYLREAALTPMRMALWPLLTRMAKDCYAHGAVDVF